MNVPLLYIVALLVERVFAVVGQERKRPAAFELLPFTAAVVEVCCVAPVVFWRIGV